MIPRAVQTSSVGFWFGPGFGSHYVSWPTESRFSVSFAKCWYYLNPLAIQNYLAIFWWFLIRFRFPCTQILVHRVNNLREFWKYRKPLIPLAIHTFSGDFWSGFGFHVYGFLSTKLKIKKHFCKMLLNFDPPGRTDILRWFLIWFWFWYPLRFLVHRVQNWNWTRNHQRMSVQCTADGITGFKDLLKRTENLDSVDQEP